MKLDWSPNKGASEEEIEYLVSNVNHKLPEGYLELLRKFNGGEGELALEAMWLQFWSISEVVELQFIEPYSDYPELFFFASNGGIESIAFKTDNQTNLEVVMLDLIDGIESTTIIANSLTEFEDAIGKEYKGYRDRNGHH